MREALADFQAESYLSCAVMTGVASEKTLLCVRDAVEGALNASVKQKFTDSSKERPIKRVCEEIGEHG